MASEDFDREDQHEEIDEDSVIVYATMTVEDSDDLDRDRLQKLCPNSDHVEAHHRVTGNVVAFAGDDPAAYVCPECGEGVHSKRDIDDTPFYRHHDNKECPRDVRDALEQKREERRKENRTPLWRRAVSLALGLGVSIAGMVAVMHTIPTSTMTVNGEPVMVPSGDVVSAIGVGSILLIVVTILVAMKYAPRGVGRGGLR